jgi:2-methylcitrate dehydratase
MLAVMDKVTVEMDAECMAGYPDKLLNIVTVKLKDGRSHTARVEYHRGHHKNPMTELELEEKFTNCTQNLLSPERRRAALDAMWNLDKAKDLTAFMHQLAL